MWGSGDVVGGVVVPLFVSTLIDPNQKHTYTFPLYLYVICLWHNCRSVNLVPLPHPPTPPTLSLSVAQKHADITRAVDINTMNYRIFGSGHSASSAIISIVTDGVFLGLGWKPGITAGILDPCTDQNADEERSFQRGSTVL